jgi:uncharacterized protein YjdB
MSGTSSGSALGKVIERSRVTGKLTMKSGWTEMRKWDTEAATLVEAYKNLLEVHRQTASMLDEVPAEMSDAFDEQDKKMVALELEEITNTPEARKAATAKVGELLKLGSALRDKVKRARDRKDQTIVWQPPALTYGAALSTLPPAAVKEGNMTATIVYAPPLDAKVLPVGVTPITVSVPGNDAYKPFRQTYVVSVAPRSLVVRVQPTEMAAGEKPPPLQYAADGLVPPDTIAVEFKGAPDATSRPNQEGYEVTPEVTFTRGSAASYAITLNPGRVVVTRSFADMDTDISELRRAILKLTDPPKSALLKRLDDTKDMRDRPAELQKELRAIDGEHYEAAYKAVESVAVVLTSGHQKIERDETLRLTATIKPADATEPGVTWSTDQPELVSVSEQGEVTRKAGSIAGGTAVLRATSKARGNATGTLTIEVTPKPTAVRIVLPAGPVFYGYTDKLIATVEPVDAPQSVTWRLQSGGKGFATLSADGQLVVSAPRNSSRVPGALKVRAISQLVPEVFDEDDVPLAGYPVASIRIKTAKKTIAAGETVTFEAEVKPNEAAQAVSWALNGKDIATLAKSNDTTATVTFAKPGQVELTATAADGSGTSDSRWFGAAVPLISLSIECPKATIKLTELMTLKPLFDPPEANCRVDWKSSKPAVVVVDRLGQVQPAAPGKATVQVSADGKTASVEVEVKLDGATVLTPQQAGVIMPLIDAFAEKIGITGNQNAKRAYDKYKYTLRQDVSKGGRVSSGGTTPINFDTIRAELIDLRNKSFMLEHANWLEHAGFRAARNCMLRDEGNIVLTMGTFSGHVTMFDTGAQLAIGNSADALARAVFRDNANDFNGLHATAYVGSGTEQQFKAYASGALWWPPADHSSKWGFNVGKAREELVTWLNNNKDAGINALTTYHDQIKKNDNAAFG